jgi:glyoxylase-like metal-dependent hydrolase (beta-lactamase superfamily II)
VTDWRLDLGGVVLRGVADEDPFVLPRDLIFPGSDPALLARSAALDPCGVDAAADAVMLRVQVFVIETPGRTIIVDGGVGDDKERPARPSWHRRRTDFLQRLGIAPAEVQAVLFTHLHADHVGWATRLVAGRWVPTFPNARYVFSAGEFAHWNAENAKAPVLPFADSVLPIVAAGRADMVADDHAITEDIRLEATPGHTPHHVALRVGRGDHEALFTGDLIHSPLQARYPELSMRADFDPAQAAATRRRVLDCACEARTLLCFAHFPSPSRARLSRWGDGFRAESVG